ncbi:hypothetical protein GXP67_29965 [Rhodocytophaga rosea]|uniref:Uncharacterized protein n=1 Tax=Rhodocytophaga rosea TaxID=2704465 RepID=A0A6C0GR88_9BACT|nr:hypothetical protein [Rhodocytophaga rosea]QHT70579.1 hypothetical protein GXP67_29965 [Rhodocytophaga rosea]
MIKVEAVYSGGQINSAPRLLYKTVSFLGIRIYTYINADYKFKLEKEKIERQIRFDQMDELEHA